MIDIVGKSCLSAQSDVKAGDKGAKASGRN